MLIATLLGCLIHEDVYETRRVELADADVDGWSAQDDCDDADASVHPEALETCDGVDQDCDGEVDEGAGVDGLYEAGMATALAAHRCLGVTPAGALSGTGTTATIRRSP